jgi:hypothetical protein
MSGGSPFPVLRHERDGVEGEAGGGVLLGEGGDGVARCGGGSGDARELAAGGGAEDRAVRVVEFDRVAVLVHEGVVAAAEGDQVVDGRLAAVGPVLDVNRQIRDLLTELVDVHAAIYTCVQ